MVPARTYRGPALTLLCLVLVVLAILLIACWRNVNEAREDLLETNDPLVEVTETADETTHIVSDIHNHLQVAYNTCENPAPLDRANDGLKEINEELKSIGQDAQEGIQGLRSADDELRNFWSLP